mgnify:CR=1 FL=1|jgi:hypothetical protein
MNLHKAIRSIHNSVVTIYGNTQENITAYDIKNNEINIDWTQVNAWVDSEQSNYAQQRRNAYPEIGDQLDMLWHSIDQDPQLKSKYFDFYEAIKAVKVKYPKNG